MDKVILLTFLVTVISSCYAFDCTGLADGIYELSCQAYVICNASVATQRHCPPTTTYVHKTQSCGNLFDASYPCNESKVCTSMADIRYADVKNGCKSYYRCYNGAFYGHHFCPQGLVFDEKSQVCQYRQLVGPPCGTFSLVGR